MFSVDWMKVKIGSGFAYGLSSAVNNIAEEPDAVVPHVRICVGAPR